MGGLYRLLEVARQNRCQVFLPSSIGTFGPTTTPDNTPQDPIQRPITIYGITKVAGELLSDYCAQHFELDTRGLRLPGTISHVVSPGGGTTDFAVDIFYQAIRYRHYTCFLGLDTRLDVMYMPDTIDPIIRLMEADPARLIHRNAFNVTAMNFPPARLAEEIAINIPQFAIDYEVDPGRQAIVDPWPRSIDASAARAEWGWSPAYTLESITRKMLEKLGSQLRAAP